MGLGYRSQAYRSALADVGDVLPLGETGGFVLSRVIAGGALRDLMGPYPVLCCDDWQALAGAVAHLGPEYVTFTCVTDPFCPLDAPALAAVFPHLRPLHSHYVIDLSGPLQISKHHRKKLRRPNTLRIEMRTPRPADLSDWSALYAGLAQKHGIRDMRRFDDASFAHQLAVPGARITLAWEGDMLLGADLYYLDGPVAYAHLSAYAACGYDQSVSYPMMAHAIEALRGDVRWIDLGGAPVTQDGGGMGHFKRGWTEQTRISYLCGRVLNADAFHRLCPGGRPEGGPDYFPPYRAGEFARK